MDDYQAKALRTLSTQFHIANGNEEGAVTPALLHGAIGLATEAGELLDAIKRVLYYGGTLDRLDLVEELGDLEWYMAIVRDALGVDQDEVQRINIAKLRVRYPEKFTSQDALHRDLGQEREIVENGE